MRKARMPGPLPELVEDRWLIIQPLLPPLNDGQVRSKLRLPDRSVFAVLAILLLNHRPWRDAQQYEVSATTVCNRWHGWCEAGVFTSIQREVDKRTVAGRWAWNVALASESRQERSALAREALPRQTDADQAPRQKKQTPKKLTLTKPTPEERRLAWAVQNRPSDW